MKIGILGTGAYGFGLATAIRENKHEVLLQQKKLQLYLVLLCQMI